MKLTNHILLDVNKNSLNTSNQYWIFKYFNSITSKNLFNNVVFHKKFFMKKENILLNNLINSQLKFTIKYSYSNPSLFLNKTQNFLINTKFQTKTTVKHRELDSNYITYIISDFLKFSNENYDKKTLRRLFKSVFLLNRNTANNFNLFQLKEFKSDKIFNLFNINFLKKEKMYTKLKYSRVPQYDIVSGGAAALLAGFLGFLITEKFGFELLDSADFYFLFMYLVFLFFILRLFLKLFNSEKSSWNPFSLKWLFFFYKNLLLLVINFIKNFFNKLF